MKKYITIFISTFLLSSTIFLILSPNVFSRRNSLIGIPELKDSVLSVALSDLIMHSEFYDGKMIKVKGSLTLKFEVNGLYIMKNCPGPYDYDNPGNALWVDIFKKRYLMFSTEKRHYDIGISDFDIPHQYFDRISGLLNGKNVEITGTYYKNLRGHMNKYKGTITDIKFIRTLQSQEFLDNDSLF
jgi:hypothetical protein